MRSDLTFDPYFKVKLGSAIFKGPKTHLLLFLQGWDVKPNYKKSSAEILLMRSDLTFKVKRRLTFFKGPTTHLLLAPEAWGVEANCRTSCVGNL